MKKILAAMFVLPALFIAGLFGYVLYRGPRMTVQPHIRSFQAILPPHPAGIVPTDVPERLPAPTAAAQLKNPIARNAKSVQWGEVYYRYYCVFCHGDHGDGNGPVGQSYQPVPADLRSQKIKSYQDGQILRAMLTGVGHEPVLQRVVPPQHRWYIVLYVRSLQGS